MSVSTALTTVEAFASNIGVDIETLLDTDYHAFLNSTSTLFADLKAYAKATGAADVATLLSDLKADLQSAITSYLATGGNVSAAIAAFATTELGKLGTELTADLKNAFYGAIAIVGADLNAIVGTSSGSGTASGKKS